MMKTYGVKLGLCLFTGALMLLGLWNGDVWAREVTDMAGRTVTIPDNLTKIYSASPPGYAFLYNLAPEMLCGRAFEARSETEQKLIRPEIACLPLIGVFTGDGMQACTEMLMTVKPDLVVEVVITGAHDYRNDAMTTRSAEMLERLGIPYIYVLIKDITEYPVAYKFLGEVLGKEKRADELSAYIVNTLNEIDAVVAQIPPPERPGVYYAEGPDGLSTENAESFRTYLLKLAGDVNVHRTSFSATAIGGLEKIPMEQIIKYNPDIILAFEKSFYNTVYDNPAWRNIKAVKNKKVLWIPRGPFNWFDRPASFMQGIGLKWLVHSLYPKEYPIDIVQEALDFYELFLGAALTYEEMQRLIYP